MNAKPEAVGWHADRSGRFAHCRRADALDVIHSGRTTVFIVLVGCLLVLTPAGRSHAQQPDQACCLPDGTCQMMPHDACVASGGDPQGPGTDCANVECVPLKWSQPPLFNAQSPAPECFWGWDEMAWYDGPQILADDWLCEDDRPVSDIHWWGSYRGWTGIEPPPGAPVAFDIGIWTDEPVGTGFSHPQKMIWQYRVHRGDLNERPVACDFHPDFMDAVDGCFRYDLYLPRDAWFFQNGGDEPTVYWLSINAVYEDCPCNGDVDGSGFIDQGDVLAVGNPACWGQPASACPAADVDCSGVIDQGDIIVIQCQFGQPAPGDPDCCGGSTGPPEFPWGWKTREHFFNDAAVRVFDPNAPVVGDDYLEGSPVLDLAGAPWDLAFVLTGDRHLRAKWIQQPHRDADGIDIASNVAFNAIKWEQLPNPQFAGVHAHDSNFGPIIIADDWLCEGGIVTDFHWWGTVEDPGAGLAGFQLSIHVNDPGSCLPMEPAAWMSFAPAGAVTMTPTGVLNNVGLEIIRYDYILPEFEYFFQEPGQTYWFDLMAVSVIPDVPFVWIWAEANRSPVPILCPAAEWNVPGPWRHIFWTTQQWYSDMAFAVTSTPIPDPVVNKVVADDFTSDGRPIHGLQWWGSYFDPRFDPFEGIGDPYLVDGWLVSFHHTDPVLFPGCPPDLNVGDPPPTALAIYFAPADAVELTWTGTFDCLQHPVYAYKVKLEDCCLLCSEVDPRDGAVPGAPEAFYEVHRTDYWLDVVAVVGARWVPTAAVPGCAVEPTGHLPSPEGDGDFWGWHTSYHMRLQGACQGQLVDTSPLPPACWNYGNWDVPNWDCPFEPPPQIAMAFELYSYASGPACPHTDVNLSGITEGLDVSVITNSGNWSKPVELCLDERADVTGDRIVNGLDVAAVTSSACFGKQE